MKNYGPLPKLDRLKESDFPDTSIHIRFQDEGTVRIRNAFYQREGERVVVYSKSCGYHSFHLSCIETIRGAIRADR